MTPIRDLSIDKKIFKIKGKVVSKTELKELNKTQ